MMYLTIATPNTNDNRSINFKYNVNKSDKKENKTVILNDATLIAPINDLLNIVNETIIGNRDIASKQLASSVVYTIIDDGIKNAIKRKIMYECVSFERYIFIKGSEECDWRSFLHKFEMGTNTPATSWTDIQSYAKNNGWTMIVV